MNPICVCSKLISFFDFCFFIEKPGTCPIEKKRNDCISVTNECNNDFECYGESKCCFDGCKKTCKERPDSLCCFLHSLIFFSGCLAYMSSLVK